MNIFLSILAGAAWGALFAALNAFISKKLIARGNKGIAAMSVIRMAVDLAALGSVYLLRNALPLSFEYTIIAAAVTLSTLGIILIFRLAAGK